MKPLRLSPAQVIAHLLAAVTGLQQMGGYEGAEAGIGESIGQMAELTEAGEESHDAGVAKTEPRCTLAVGEGRQNDLLQCGRAGQAALAHALSVQETLVGLSADGTQVR